MKISILFLIFILLIAEIYTIGGAENEEQEGGISEIELNLQEVCPCDLTENICDFGCCCDEDCLDYMFDQNYMELFEECDKSSSFRKNLYSKLEYCDEYQKSLDDLYNPLVLAFKILKRGFCLVKEQKHDEDDNNNNYNIDNDQQNEDNQEFENYKTYKENERSFVIENITDFTNVAFNVPIALPSGKCLFGHFQVKKLQDYEVTCSYETTQINIKYLSDYYDSSENYFIENNYYNLTDNITDRVIKKIEIIYYLDSNQTFIYRYFEENHDEFQDLTLKVMFLKNESDYPRSGNPGYIKGKPLLFNEKNNFSHIYVYTIIPIDENYCTNLKENLYYYYDNYFDNILTFEDFIIYGYSNNNCLNRNYFNEKTVGKFGNSNLNLKTSDWVEINEGINECDLNNIDESLSFFLLLGNYKYSGTVDNPHNQIYKLEYHSQTNESSSKHYFLNKSIKPKKMETKWEYSPGPGFILLPRNIMYPFKIGTTKYSEKK